MNKNLVEDEDPQPQQGIRSATEIALLTDQGLLSQEAEYVRAQARSEHGQEQEAGEDVASFIQRLRTSINGKNSGQRGYNEMAWRELHDRYYKYVCKCCYTALKRLDPRTASYDLAADRAQDTLERAITIIDKFKGHTPADVERWLSSTANYICLERRRADQHEPPSCSLDAIAAREGKNVDDGDRDISDDGEGEIAGTEYGEDVGEQYARDEIWRARTRVMGEILSTEEKTILLHKTQGMHYREIIETMGLETNPGALKTRVLRIKNKVRQACCERGLANSPGGPT